MTTLPPLVHPYLANAEPPKNNKIRNNNNSTEKYKIFNIFIDNLQGLEVMRAGKHVFL